MLDGEKPVEIKVAAYGGYVVPGTLSVPVTFHHGSFDAELNLSALYTGGKVDKGRYYLQLSPIDSGLTAATSIFALNKAVAPQPKPSPAPSPTSPATAEPSATAEPTSEPAPEPTGSPTSPAPTSPAAPSSQPSASAVPSVRPTESASVAPAPQTTEPDQNAPKPIPDDGGRPGTDNAPGNNPGGKTGNSGDTGSSGDHGSGTGVDTGSQTDSSAPQAPDAGSESGSSTAQDGSAQQHANAGAAPAPNAGGSGGENAHASDKDSAASAQASPEADASSQRTVRPDRSPVAPVTSAAHLSADNAGSLSGSRQGNIVNLVLPKSKAQAGEWVSVFVFPGATTKGWVQVDDANSVSIDISTFDSGSYELAVADRDNSLLGWAKLEISSASSDPRSPAQAQLLTFPDNVAEPTKKGLSANDMLLGSAGGLLVVGAVSLLVAAFSGMPLRAPRTSQRLRLPRRH